MSKKVAYLSAEFAVSPELPTFAGGLGVLAADTLYQASDRNLPLVGVTLFYVAGCFNQWLDEEGNPREECVRVDPRRAGLADTGVVVKVPLPGRSVHLKVWKKKVGKSTLYLLDADLPENSELDRTMAHRLYDGRALPSRVERSALLGVGSVRALRELGEEIAVWHINDDHTAFSILERIRERLSEGDSLVAARAKVKEETVFTTHTPSLGAESVFGLGEMEGVLKALFRGTSVPVGDLLALGERRTGDGELRFSLTVFAMRHSRAINGVSRAHQKVSRSLWKFVWSDFTKTSSGRVREIPITHITNGIYPKRWVAEPIGALYRKYLAVDWDQRTDDPALWGRVKDIPDSDFWQARAEAKKLLAAEISRRAGRKVDPQALVLGFARRFVEYKQPTLLISNRERLASILRGRGRPVYLLMSGKAQPGSSGSGKLVREVVRAAEDPIFMGRLIFLENYNLDIARLLVSGSDVWLNTPIPGHEACGTSGMKALYNGVLHASTLDGWWAEAFDGENGWKVDGPDFADSLYALLEKEIVPLYYNRDGGGVPAKWVAKVKHALANLGHRFTTARMLKEYYEKVYGLGKPNV